MKINYQKYLRKNMINVLKDVLKEFEINGPQEGHHLYITFNTQNSKVKMQNWLKEKYPKQMTIVIQYEYWNFKVNKNSFNINLSFENIKINLVISFDSVISFADPYANFGLKIIQDDVDIIDKSKKIKFKKNDIKISKNNVIKFKKLK